MAAVPRLLGWHCLTCKTDKPVNSDLLQAKRLGSCLARNRLFNKSLAVAEMESVRLF